MPQPLPDRFQHIAYPPARMAMSRLAYRFNACAHDNNIEPLTVHISLAENLVDFLVTTNQGDPIAASLLRCMREGLGKEPDRASIAYTADITIPYADPLLGP